MARFPRIDSPCPYKSNLAAVMDGDFCRMCERNVFDLSAMGEEERAAFLAGCTGEVCVSYRLPLRPALAAAALAAAAVAFPTAAAAQEADAAAAVETVMADDLGEVESDWMITVGGIKDPSQAQYIETEEDSSVPELPVVYEDTPSDPAEAAPVSSPSGS